MIPEIAPYNNYTGDGSTTKFDFDFYIEDSTQLIVQLTQEDGTIQTLTNNTDYTIHEVGNKNGSYITFPITGSSYSTLSSSEIISLSLSLPIAQESEYGTSSELDLVSLEYSFDYLTRICQIMNRQVTRALKVAEGSNIDTDELALDVEKIADISDDVSTVAEIAADVTAVKNNATNITTVAGSISNVDAVGGNITDVNSVAADLTNIDTVAGSISNVNTVGNNISSVNAVAGSISNVNTIKEDLTNIDNVADDLVNINAVAGSISNVDTVAAISSDVTAVKNNATNINAVAGDLTNINAVAADLTNIDAASSNAQLAKDWANKMNGTVDGYEYSAKYYAQQAAAGQVQANWNESDASSKAYIWNKPTIPDAQIQSDWEQSDNTKKDFIKNKPDLTTKQDTLVSGTNIKTINNNSILGSGNLTLDGLPSQTGNEGKFLTTDGTDASWASAPFRNIGEIVFSTTPQTDAGLHLADGALISGSGIYSDFVDYIADLYDSGDYTDIFETEANWQTAVTTYGVCGKFVYDSVNNTVRLPKYSNKIYTSDINSTAPVIGNGMTLGLTNGTSNDGLYFDEEQSGTNRFLSVRSSSYGASLGGTTSGNTRNIARFNNIGLTTDGTKSGIIAQLSNITTSLEGYYYIVIATTTKTDIQVDIDEIAADLNNLYNLQSLNDLGNARLQYAPFAINDGTVLNGENSTLKTPGGTPIEVTKYLIPALTADTSNFGTASITGNRSNSAYQFTTKNMGSTYGAAITFTMQLSQDNYLPMNKVASFSITSMNGFDGRDYYGINGVKITYTYTDNTTEVVYDNSSLISNNWNETPIVATADCSSSTGIVKTILVETYRGAAYGDCGYFTMTYVDTVNTSSILVCDPCTITTCDGRTFVDNSSKTLDVSTETDGTYNVLKDYSTGALSLVSGLAISKTNKVAWTQPILTSNGTIGGNNFAVYSDVAASSKPLYYAFDDDTTNYFETLGTVAFSNYILLYNPEPLKITNISTLDVQPQYYWIKSATIYGSNDNSVWTSLKSISNQTAHSSLSTLFDLSTNDQYYKYYKITDLTTNNTGGYTSLKISQINITATRQASNYLNTSTIPANLYINGTLDNNKIYLGDVTVASGAVTAITNREFNDSGYLVGKYIAMPDYSAGISITSTGVFTPTKNGVVTVVMWGSIYTTGVDIYVGTDTSGEKLARFSTTQNSSILSSGSFWLNKNENYYFAFDNNATYLYVTFYPLKGE